jgi:two-component system CheB/CheR fusion protein
VDKTAPFPVAGKKREERLAKKNNSAPATHDAQSDVCLFPIVGVGASAGGLEALDLFLRNVPVDSGIAFVIVQHLEPTQKDFMVELLQRSTDMKVLQVKDCTPFIRAACT